MFLLSCVQTEPSRTEFVFGTYCTVTLYENGRESVYRDIFSRLREIDNLMSVNIPSSDISRINAAAGIEAVKVHEDVFSVIKRSLYFAEISGGAFDPSIGPLVTLWGIGGENARVPSHEEIDVSLPLVNWRNIELDDVSNSVFLKHKGMSLDLGAIAKGYAADAIAEILGKANFKRAIIDLGGNITVYGEKKDRSAWRVGIQNPKENRGAYIGVIHTAQNNIVTSGINERFFIQDGIQYHHLLSASNGYPVNNEFLSVTIITSVSMDADALSTAIFVMGYEKGKELIESMNGAEAVFVLKDNSVYVTGDLDFTLTDVSFKLISNL